MRAGQKRSGLGFSCSVAIQTLNQGVQTTAPHSAGNFVDDFSNKISLLREH